MLPPRIAGTTRRNAYFPGTFAGANVAGITGKVKGDLAAEAQDIIVLYDFNQGTKIPLPAALKAVIAELGTGGGTPSPVDGARPAPE